LARKDYPVWCECGWPILITSVVRDLTLDFEYRSGGVNGAEVERCPKCDERLPLALVLDMAAGDRPGGAVA
jgi:hypothetical protein